MARHVVLAGMTFGIPEVMILGSRVSNRFGLQFAWLRFSCWFTVVPNWYARRWRRRIFEQQGNGWFASLDVPYFTCGALWLHKEDER